MNDLIIIQEDRERILEAEWEWKGKKKKKKKGIGLRQENNREKSWK